MKRFKEENSVRDVEGEEKESDSPNGFSESLESNRFKRSASSLSRSEPPSTSNSHENDNTILNVGNNKVNPSNISIRSDNGSKVLHTSCYFPQLSVNKKLKGKEVISDEKINHEPPQDGVSLRDKLRPGGHKVNKVEILVLFKKIVELVDFAHSQGIALQDLRPSCFILLPSNKVKYIGPFPQIKIQDVLENNNINNRRSLEIDDNTYETSRCPNAVMEEQTCNLMNVQIEKIWYSTPASLNEKTGTFAANIYSLGVLLFELLYRFESWEMHSSVMMDLQRRIFPPSILLEYPVEAGFCLWLLHPDPSSRPTTREILQSELLCSSVESNLEEDSIPYTEIEDTDSDMLLYFLTILEEQKNKHTSMLEKDLECLESDIKDVRERNSLVTSCSYKNFSKTKIIKSIDRLQDAYFLMRYQTDHANSKAEARSDNDLLKNRENFSRVVENENSTPGQNQDRDDRIGSFFDSVCKFACYSRLKICGTLRNGDFGNLNSSNVICSLSVDRDDDYIAAAGVSKKIKIFECSALLNDSIDIHYPVVEMVNQSKLSCVCWNNYIKNYLASTDYDGIVQIWDASTGQGFSQHTEHQKRAWSVDFSQSDPTKFASGSDDCTVKLWSINEKNSTSSIWNPANVCCVQFSAYSSHLLVFGSADYRIYCYDIRHTRIPWCTLAGHGKAVSYVRFVDYDTIVSASTDNTLKLWDLNKTSSTGLSSGACSLTFSGHTNNKNFVGLSALDGYIACGSETNEVFTYYKSLPMPITSHKIGSIDPISGLEIADHDTAQFVSSICWRRKSNMIVAANSAGNINLLQMV